MSEYTAYEEGQGRIAEDILMKQGKLSSEEIQTYDDMLPVSVMGIDLLDRHNDRIATFETTVEKEEKERITRTLNSHDALLEIAKWVAAGHTSCLDIINKAQAAITQAEQKP